MWSYNLTTLTNDTHQYQLSENNEVLSNQQFLSCLQHSEPFIRFFNELLQSSEFEGYFWETKPVNEHTLNSPFEFVLVESKRIAQKRPDPRPFMEHLTQAHLAAAFSNLGRNAQLIAPAISGNPKQYAHIAGFVRHAPQEQILAFWQLVGQEFQQAIGRENKWLSTAGFGVNWLHVRIDTHPKYYRHQPYRLAN